MVQQVLSLINPSSHQSCHYTKKIKITLDKKSIPSTKSFSQDISTQKSELTDGIHFLRHLLFFKKVGHELSLGSQITEERTKRLNHEVWRQGGTTPLSHWSVYKYNPPSVVLCPPLPPLNWITSMWGYIPMPSLTSFVPFAHPQQNKNKSNLPGNPWQHPTSQMFSKFTNPKKDIKSFQHCYELLFLKG